MRQLSRVSVSYRALTSKGLELVNAMQTGLSGSEGGASCTSVVTPDRSVSDEVVSDEPPVQATRSGSGGKCTTEVKQSRKCDRGMSALCAGR